MYEHDFKQGHSYTFGIENPHGLLERRGYMQEKSWPSICNMRYIRFDSCAFNHPEGIMKPMSYWTNSDTYAAKGSTTDGLCRRRCLLGQHTDAGGYVHPHRVRELKKPKAKNALAPEWVEAVLQDAINRRSSPSQTVVIDLFAGWQSIAPLAHKMGLGYIAVDVMGKRI